MVAFADFFNRCVVHAIIGHIQGGIFTEPLCAFAAGNTSPEDVASAYMAGVSLHYCSLTIKWIIIDRMKVGLGKTDGDLIIIVKEI